MPPARRRPPENSTSGLSLLEPEHTVVVTREEHHQHALLRYAPGPGRTRHVATELRFAPVTHGTHRGQRGIEVLLDGQRVGELTRRMTQRYGPMVEDALQRGERPGCVADVGLGPRGIEVELRLPDVRDDAPASAGGAGRNGRRIPPLWIGAGVGAVLLVIGVGVGNNSAEIPPPTTAASSTSTPSPSPTRTTTLTPTPSSSAPTSEVVAAEPPPAPKVPASKLPAPETPTPKKTAAPKKTTRPAPEPAEEQQSGCDPNYSGCVPIASDVDCSGGSGNGPAYVAGPIRVTGSDKYDLDRDGNGVACE